MTWGQQTNGQNATKGKTTYVFFKVICFLNKNQPNHCGIFSIFKNIFKIIFFNFSIREMNTGRRITLPAIFAPLVR